MGSLESEEVFEPGSARLFIDAEMDAAWCVEIGGGIAAIYSSRCPAPSGVDAAEPGANEDGAAVFALEAGRCVLAVADGLGGQPGGASASRLTLEALQGALTQSEGSATRVRAAILDGIESANRGVLELGIGAGTTIAAAEILLDTVRPYHVGDSEILVVGQRGLIKLQTLPHSPVGYAVEAGVLDREDAMHHDERHIVSNLIGSAEMRIEIGSPMTLAPNDTVVIATDGLFDNLHVGEIVDAVRTGPIPEVSARLAEACQARMTAPEAGQPSKPDDLTFVVYRRK